MGSELTLVQKLTPNDPSQGKVFGNAVSMSGDSLMIVGAYGDAMPGNLTDSGAAYVFERSGSTWAQVQKLQPSDRAAFDDFGFSVAIQNDLAVVGAYRDDGAAADQGSAYVFRRSNGTWSQVAKLVAPDGGSGDWLGHRVAIDGTSIIVGAPKDDVGANVDQGSAYVFVPNANATDWVLQQKLPAPPSIAGNDEFGYSVSIRGDIAAVGARLDDIGAAASQGAVYVYQRDGTGNWSLQSTLFVGAPDGQASDLFGSAVALSLDGRVLAVGAQTADFISSAGTGAAYVFEWNGSSWMQRQKLLPFSPNQGEQFGAALALTQFRVLVGAFGENLVGNASGTAYDYQRSQFGTDFTSNTPQLTPSPGQSGANFGVAVATSGGHAAVGAWFDDNNALSDAGAVYAYEGFPKVPTVVVLESSDDAVAVNGAVTFTATVSGGGPRGSDSGGSVSFFDGGTPLTCSSGAEERTSEELRVTCQTSSLSVGTHQVTASYSGDIERASSTSPPLTQIIESPVIDVSPQTLPSGLMGAPYDQTISASGSVDPFTFTHPTSTLPTGLSLVSATGRMSGVPSALGTYAFEIRATDSSSPSVGGPFFGTRQYSMTVSRQETTVAIGSIVPSPSVVGSAYTVSVSVLGQATAPEGQVTVTDGTGGQCSFFLAASANPKVSVGSCPLTSSSSGIKTITASYGTQTNWSADDAQSSHTVESANEPPQLSYAPSAGTEVVLSGAQSTLGAVAGSQVHVTSVGGRGAGSVTLGCNVAGGNFTLQGAPSGPIGVGASPAPISVQCTRTAAVQNGTLSCTETASPGGAQQGRSWPLVCPGADAVPPTLAYSPQPNNTITFPDGAVNATVASSIQVTSSGAVGNGSTTLSCTLGGTNPTAFQLTGGNGQVVTGAQGGTPLQLGCTLGNTLRTATLDCTETYSTGGSSGRSWPLSCPPGIAVAQGTVTVGARNAVRGGKVAIPISFRGEGSTRDFRAEASFNKTQLSVLSVQGVGGATCSRRPAPNDDRIEVQRSTPGPLLAEDTRYCEVTFQVSSTAPGGALPLAVVASTCTDTGGTSRLCSRQDGRVAVAALDPSPADGAAIVIAAYEGTASQSRTLRIVNRGTNPQQVQGCTLLPATGLSVSQPAAFPLVIAPQTTGQVTVSCAMPPLNQPRQATLECTADDAMRSVMRYGVTCTTLAAGTPLPAEQVLDIEQRAGEQLASAAARGTDSGPLTKGASASSVVTFLGAPLGGSDGNGRVAVYADTGSMLAKTRGEWQAGGLRPIATLDARRGPQLKGVAPTNERFGQAVALHPEGTTLAVGAPGPVGGGQPGRVYLFDRPAGGWETFDSRTALPQELQAPPLPGGTTAEYGAALAYSEDGDLIVGAPGSAVGLSGAGAVFVHTNNGSGLDPAISVTSGVFGVGNGRLGSAVAANDGDILVGAPGELSNGVRTGAAYRLTLQGGVLGAATRVMPTATLAANDDYGRALHLAGDQWLIGSPGDDTGQGTDSGSVYVFRAGANPTYLAQLLPAAGTAQGAGSALSSTSRHWFVGAPLADNTAPDAGRVYVFLRRGAYAATEAPSSQLENSGGRAGDGFGKALAMGGGLAVIGVPQADLTLSDTQQLNDVGRADPFLLIELFGSGFE